MDPERWLATRDLAETMKLAGPYIGIVVTALFALDTRRRLDRQSAVANDRQLASSTRRLQKAGKDQDGLLCWVGYDRMGTYVQYLIEVRAPRGFSVIPAELKRYPSSLNDDFRWEEADGAIVSQAITLATKVDSDHVVGYFVVRPMARRDRSPHILVTVRDRANRRVVLRKRILAEPHD